jgi:hypothetical protein
MIINSSESVSLYNLRQTTTIGIVKEVQYTILFNQDGLS